MALALDSNNVRSLYRRGLASFELGDFRAARRDFLRARQAAGSRLRGSSNPTWGGDAAEALAEVCEEVVFDGLFPERAGSTSGVAGAGDKRKRPDAGARAGAGGVVRGGPGSVPAAGVGRETVSGGAGALIPSGASLADLVSRCDTYLGKIEKDTRRFNAACKKGVHGLLANYHDEKNANNSQREANFPTPYEPTHGESTPGTKRSLESSAIAAVWDADVQPLCPATTIAAETVRRASAAEKLHDDSLKRFAGCASVPKVAPGLPLPQLAVQSNHCTPEGEAEAIAPRPTTDSDHQSQRGKLEKNQEIETKHFVDADKPFELVKILIQYVTNYLADKAGAWVRCPTRNQVAHKRV
eukprot:GHVT01064554.1.p1 GENE.GHVT01064554.1~~GHVT01064554.1.p1  ORF type:complete len:355 (-),score=65.99 GHVT01064554.1:1242-2306(-)